MADGKRPTPLGKRKVDPMATGKAYARQEARIKADMEKKAAAAPKPKSERKPMPAATPVKPDNRIAGRTRSSAAIKKQPLKKGK